VALDNPHFSAKFCGAPFQVGRIHKVSLKYYARDLAQGKNHESKPDNSSVLLFLCLKCRDDNKRLNAFDRFAGYSKEAAR
jgi:hypothetical protein